MGRISHVAQHYGLYKTSAGQYVEAFIQWRDDKEGFVIYETATNRVLDNTAYPTVASFRDRFAIAKVKDQFKAQEMAAQI